MVGALNGDLVLIRHGQTHCARNGRFCGAHEGRLTEVGRLMVKAVGDVSHLPAPWQADPDHACGPTNLVAAQPGGEV